MNTRASYTRVLETGAQDHMPIQKYDIPIARTEDLTFDERYWLNVNAPVFDEEGRVAYIAQHVVDVTDHERLIIHHGGEGSEHVHEEHLGSSQVERLSKLMVDRELRMVELKKQLAECKEGKKE